MTIMPRLSQTAPSGMRRTAKEDFTSIYPTGSSPGDGAIFASILDFAKWDQDFYKCKVGGPQWGKQMLVRGRLNDGTTLDYAFGLKVDHFRGLDRVWHSGRWKGYRSTFVR